MNVIRITINILREMANFSRDHLEKSWVYVPHCVIISISVQAVSFQAQAIVCVFLQKPFLLFLC